MNKFILSLALAAAVCTANAAELTVNHTQLGNFKAEFNSALAANSLVATDVTKITIVSVGGVTMNDTDFAVLRSTYGFSAAAANRTLKVLDLSQLALNEFGSLPAATSTYGILARMYSLEEVVLPDKIVVIPQGAFCLCTNLKKINLPNGLTKIRPYSFCGCQNLELTEFPETLQEINNNAFYRSTKIDDASPVPQPATKVAVANAPRDLKILGECSLAYTSCAFTSLPDGIAIGKEALRNTPVAITEFPANVKFVQSKDNGTLTTDEAQGAFVLCPNMINITIPETWTKLPARTFYTPETTPRHVYYRGKQKLNFTKDDTGFSGTFGPSAGYNAVTFHVLKEMAANYSGKVEALQATTSVVNNAQGKGTVSLAPANPAHGLVFDLETGLCHEGDYVLTVTPNEGEEIYSVYYGLTELTANEDVVSATEAIALRAPGNAKTYNLTLRGDDSIYVNYAGTTGLENVETQQVNIRYNRAAGVINCQGAAQLYNISGQLVMTAEGDMDVNLLPSGIYVLRCGNQSIKILK